MLEKESDNISTFAKKLKTSREECYIDVNPIFEYRFINFLTVFSTLSQILVCKECKANIKFTDQSMRGLDYKIAVHCGKYRPTIINAVPIIQKHVYDINRRIVFAMRLLGIGLNGIKKFCAFMNLPHPIFQSFYDTVVESISNATAAVREKSTKEAAIEERRLTKATNVANYKHKTAMHTEVFKAIKPIYEELSRDELLTRCVGSFIQNSNESFNATVWSMAPKFVASGKRVLDIATDLATCYYNDGYNSIMKMHVASYSPNGASQTRLKMREELHYQNEKKLMMQQSMWKDSFIVQCKPFRRNRLRKMTSSKKVDCGNVPVCRHLRQL
ncbi:hypothetical protein EAI_04127 [Harpegnathos saltator]|uniref:Mutator-like transposase domain-containing protein n=1 Tax=Harpegnathos saltator TaxID=610380 RepID=E2C5P6_HARSA|nr:hypothetical protein EAI_04127 [Harpegnathos saltator]